MMFNFNLRVCPDYDAAAVLEKNTSWYLRHEKAMQERMDRGALFWGTFFLSRNP
jgi:hypothetical protein